MVEEKLAAVENKQYKSRLITSNFSSLKYKKLSKNSFIMYSLKPASTNEKKAWKTLMSLVKWRGKVWFVFYFFHHVSKNSMTDLIAFIRVFVSFKKHLLSLFDEFYRFFFKNSFFFLYLRIVNIPNN